jgi:hypothetical protein
VDWRSTTNGEYAFRIQASAGADNRIQVSTWQTSSESTCYDSTAYDNEYLEWHFVGFSYDGTGVSIYKDANLVKYCTLTAPSGNTGTASHRIGTDPGTTWDYSGKIDEFREYTRNVSLAEITAMYQNAQGTAGFGILGTETAFYGSLTETYNSTAVEGTIQTFTLLIENASVNISDITANFTWNGTVYVPTEAVSGTNYTFSYTKVMPDIEANTTVNFSWNYTIIFNSEYLNYTLAHNQTIVPIQLTNCSADSASTTKAITFTLIDEQTGLGLDNGTASMNFTYTGGYSNLYFADVDNNFSVCIYPTGVSLDVDMEMEYGRTNYNSRSYFFDDNTSCLSNAFERICFLF